MSNCENLAKRYYEILSEFKALKQEVIEAKDKIPHFDEKYHEAEGKRAREIYKALYSQMQDKADEVFAIEAKLVELDYEFPSKNKED